MKKIIYVLSIIIAIFFTLGVIGKKIIFPFPTQFYFENLTCADIVNNKNSLVVDKQGSELIFLDNNNKINNIIHLNDANELSQIFDIARDDDYFYVLGCKLLRNSAKIDNERIVRYTLNGKNPTILYELKGNIKSTTHNLKDINVVNKSLYLTEIITNDNFYDFQTKVTKIDLNNNFQKEEILLKNTPFVYDAKYLLEDNSLYMLDYFGHLSKITKENTEYFDFAKQKTSFSLLPINKNSCVWYDETSGILYENDQIIKENLIITYLNLSNNKLIYIDQNNSSINIYDFSNKQNTEINSANYSIIYFSILLLRLISVIYLIGIIIFLIVKNLQNKFKEKDFAYLKRIGLITCATIVIIFVSIFYEKRYIKASVDTLKNEMIIMSKFFADTIENKNMEDMDITKKDSFFEENIKDKEIYYEYYGKWAELENSNNNSIYITLYKKQGDEYVILYDSSNTVQFGIKISKNKFRDKNFYDKDVQVLSFGSTKTYYYTEEVKNDKNEVIGAIEIGIDYNSFNKQALTECFEMSMSLLTIFVGIYLLIIEGIALTKAFNNKMLNELKSKKHPELYFIHSITFFQCLITSFDSIILILISKDMIEALAFPATIEKFFITIPTISLGIGNIIGPILYVIFAKKIDIRRYLITNSILITIAYLFITYTVYINNFVFFCITIFIASTLNSLIYTGISAIPYKTDIEEERYIATHEKNLGKVSASIFGALIGGVIAQNLGNTALYLVNTFSTIPIIILFFITLPKHTFYIKNETKEKLVKSAQNTLKFIFSIPLLSYILFVLGPTMISGGYKSYVFPLFTSAMNFPKIYITNFYVFARVITIILSDPIVKATKKIDYWHLTIYSLIAIGFSFMTFGINTTVIWAIIMLIINSLIDKIALPSKSMLWPRHAKNYNLDIIKTQTLMTFLEKITFSFKELIFAFLLTFGNSKACVIFGIASIICALLFSILTKNSAMAKKS